MWVRACWVIKVLGQERGRREKRGGGRRTGCGVAAGKPVEAYVCEEVIEWWGFVAPFEELLADPGVYVLAAQTLRGGISKWKRGSYQASIAKGFDESTCPIVLGRVPCSIA
jgi:hypothetical protein